MMVPMPADPGGDLPAGIVRTRFRRVANDATWREMLRDVAEETPVALEFNGIGYAVLMATPDDLADLAVGFALTERLIERRDDLVDLAVSRTPHGMLIRLTLAAGRAQRVYDRVRHRLADSSCGLCGIENLEQAIRPLPAVDAASDATDAAVFLALEALRAWQPLNAATGAVHGAALCGADGSIRLVREDVGRHNAFDKLIGAMVRQGLGWDGGFALLTSRCSYELVEKAVLAGCPLLVTISAPTGLALRRAADAGLALRVLARSDALLAAGPA